MIEYTSLAGTLQNEASLAGELQPELSLVGEATIPDHVIEWGDITGDIDDQADLIAELNSKEDNINKVTVVLPTSTNDQYPSAKAVYDLVDEPIPDSFINAL